MFSANVFLVLCLRWRIDIISVSLVLPCCGTVTAMPGVHHCEIIASREGNSASCVFASHRVVFTRESCSTVGSALVNIHNHGTG